MSRFCTSCGTTVEDTTRFCPQCGAPAPAPTQQAPGQPVPPPPPYGQPYGQPPYYVTVRPARPGRGFGIASMVLGIIGIVYSFVLFMAILSTVNMLSSYVAGPMAAGALVYSVFGILALIFGVMSRGRGYRCGVSLSGVILGSISIGLCLLAALMALTV